MSKTVAAAIILASAVSAMTGTAFAAANSGYAPVNGLKMYYQIHGQGQPPLILLHGGLGSSDMFGPVLPDLARNREVVTVDLQAHGRTADIDRPMSYQAMANDVAALVRYLNLTKVDVMGYSVGGGVAIRIAIQHPELVRQLVVVSAPFRRDGWYPEVLAGMSQLRPQVAQQMKQTPMYQSYARVAPRPDDWPALCTKLGEMLKQDYDWSSDVRKIHVPVLLAFGDSDAVRPAHAVEFFQLLGGGQRDGGWDGSGIPNARLAILPGMTHYAIYASPALISVTEQFLDGSGPGH